MADQTLRIPQGTEAFYLDEAYSHRQLIRQFEDICAHWAYLPVQTPVFDFFDAYRGLVRSGTESNVYRLIDRDGDLLVLRSDITLFLARQMGLILRSDDLPVRAYYVDTILRHEDPHDLSKNEFYQAGAELIGPTGVEADAEIMLLLLDILERWNATGAVLHIGTRALLGEFESVRNDEIAAAVAARNEAKVTALLKSAGIAPERVSFLTLLYRFIGTGDELQGFLDASPEIKSGRIASAELSALHHLLAVERELHQLGYGDRIRIDLSEVGSQPYHSGVVFQAYLPDGDAPVASGGRYDGLLKRFGFDAPSVGFAVMSRRLQSRLPSTSRLSAPPAESVSGESFKIRVEAARTLRASGKVATL